MDANVTTGSAERNGKRNLTLIPVAAAAHHARYPMATGLGNRSVCLPPPYQVPLCYYGLRDVLLGDCRVLVRVIVLVIDGDVLVFVTQLVLSNGHRSEALSW